MASCVLSIEMSLFSGFIQGLRKSFSGKRYSRKLSKCMICGEPCFSDWICLNCEVDLY